MLKKILELNYIIHLDSGLHIGGSEDSFDIGGADSTVIRNPMNNQPYIPGSSIKGKLKSLLKLKYGILDKNEIKLTDPDQIMIFSPLEEGAEDDHIQISRGLFRDAVLSEKSADQLQKYLGEGRFTEIKGENSINPLKAVAANPRFIERVPAGAEFKGKILLQVFEGDNEKKMKEFIVEAMKMLENNALGASGSRGYGRLHFVTDYEFQEAQ